MAGIVGLEPTFQAPKTRVLTVGRYPNVLATLDVSVLADAQTFAVLVLDAICGAFAAHS